MYSTGRSCEPSTKLEFSRYSFEKSTNIKFHENPSVGAELFHAYGRTARRADMTELIVAFRNSPKAANTGYLHEFKKKK